VHNTFSDLFYKIVVLRIFYVAYDMNRENGFRFQRKLFRLFLFFFFFLFLSSKFSNFYNANTNGSAHAYTNNAQ
jgi:hypothetical protein